MRALFAVSAVVLALVLVWQWWDWPPPAPGPGDAGPANAQVPADAESTDDFLTAMTPLPDKEEYATVTERPLFMSDRRPPSEEEEEEVEPEAETPSDLAAIDLNAVMITPTQSLAWIREASSQTPIRKRVGDELEGWSITEIRADRILLERQGEKDTLVLRDYENMPPPTPPPPRRPPVRRSPQSSQDEAAQGEADAANRRTGQRPAPRGVRASRPEVEGQLDRSDRRANPTARHAR